MHGSTAQGSVTVTVLARNQPPLAVDDYVETLNFAPVQINVLSNDIDPDGDVLTVVSFTQPSNGTVVQTGSGQFEYKAVAGFCGLDYFTYTIRDATGNEASATVTINVLD